MARDLYCESKPLLLEYRPERASASSRSRRLQSGVIQVAVCAPTSSSGHAASNSLPAMSASRWRHATASSHSAGIPAASNTAPGQLSRDRRRCVRVLAQVRRQQHGRAEVIARDPAHTDSGDGSARVGCPGKTIIAPRSCNPASRSRMPLCHSTSASSSPSNRLLVSTKVSAALATTSP